MSEWLGDYDSVAAFALGFFAGRFGHVMNCISEFYRTKTKRINREIAALEAENVVEFPNNPAA